MGRKVKGIAADNFKGYRPVWEMGRAANIKRKQRITGENRPGT